MFPTVAEVAADPIGVNARLGTFTTFVNLLDLCGVTVPGPPRADGLPAGLSLVGRAGADAGVAGVAARFHGEAPLDAVAPHAGGRGDGVYELAVVGAHLRGQPLNHQLTDLGATYRRSTRTAPDYRLYALAGTTPPKPGLVRVEAGGGAIEVETWSLDADAFGRFVAAVPGPLCIGTVALADGSTCQGFLCEAHAVAGAEDITGFGGLACLREPGDGRRRRGVTGAVRAPFTTATPAGNTRGGTWGRSAAAAEVGHLPPIGLPAPSPEPHWIERGSG